MKMRDKFDYFAIIIALATGILVSLELYGSAAGSFCYLLILLLREIRDEIIIKIV